MSATCVPWDVPRGHTGVSTHGGPVFSALLPPDPEPEPEPVFRTRGGGQQERGPIRGRPAVRGQRTCGGRPGQRVEEQGPWASRTQKHSEAGYGRPVDRGVWTAKTVKRPRQQPAHPQYANYWAPLTRKRYILPHSAQPRHTNCWAPRTRKQHQQEHRPQRPTERSDPMQHAKGRTGDCPGPRKETTTRRNVTRGGYVWRTDVSTHGGPVFSPLLPPEPEPAPCSGHEGGGGLRVGYLSSDLSAGPLRAKCNVSSGIGTPPPPGVTDVLARPQSVVPPGVRSPASSGTSRPAQTHAEGPQGEGLHGDTASCSDPPPIRPPFVPNPTRSPSHGPEFLFSTRNFMFPSRKMVLEPRPVWWAGAPKGAQRPTPTFPWFAGPEQRRPQSFA